MVVEPEAAKELHALQGSEKSTDEGNETTEDRDTTSDDIGDDGHAKGAAEPDSPVGEGVGAQVLRASEDTDKGVLGRDLLIVVRQLILCGKQMVLLT